jgi:very-short-patch-repair endonuclease
MTDPDRAVRDKPPARPASVDNKHAPHAYVAKVATWAAIRHVVQERGRGQPAVAWLAAQQLSVASRSQLYAAGLDRGAIAHRLQTGSLHRRHRGVYLIGSPIAPPGALELAALFACGAAGVISHRSAAALWGLVPTRPAVVDVTVVARNRRSRAGINIHRVAQLDGRDRRVRNGIRLTAPARTVIDFAADAEDDELEAAVSEARALRLIRDGELEAALDRAGIRAGVARMRWLLSVEGDQGYTKSKAERVMRKLARDAGLTQALCNAPLHGYDVDFLWPEQRLVVEVDGYQFHGHRSAFERDRRKDQVLIAAGYRVVRVTWLQLVHEPMRVAAVIAGALTASRVPG